MPSSACSTAPGRRAVRALAAGAASIALLWGAVLPASADPLSDRHAQIARELEQSRAAIDEHSSELADAEAALEASQRQLDEARAALDRTRADLVEAERLDDELAEELRRQRALLRTAQAETAQARDHVAEQQKLISSAARDAYQRQTNLAGIAVVLGGRNPSEIGQRLQWDTTIFDSTAQRMDELKVLERRLADAEAAQAAIEAKVAADKRRSADNVARITRLERSAVAQESEVAALVTRNEGFRTEAQRALDADNVAYQSLLAEEAKVQGEVASRAAEQLARGGSREDIVRLVAMGVVSSDPKTYPLVNDGPQMILSRHGFIRPVLARPGSPFGPRFHPILKYWRAHNGNDWGAACGVPLYAAQSGTVVKAGWQGGFGNYVVIDHGVIGGKSLMTGYAHQSRMAVSPGQRVDMGQLIGYVGTTGLSTGCHLHLQVYENGTPVDPMRYIP
ncbi:M23 family metallopeptidase [Propioniciclava sinopodophylli]|uniref:M23 family metallopeptidase n=1 Tax=Propioniciclava sinopodophylli TaxID=1837344 RepID=UPI0024931DC4|nr:M23 family metallopeptidase [Propioniciclava sinopodophylli]